MTAPSPTIRALLTGLIDYAGLFPPAGLAMVPAVRNYADYRNGDDAWALGRFIVPSSRLDEFEGAAAAHLPQEGDTAPWLISMLGGVDPGHDAELVFDFNERHARRAAGQVAIDTLEVKATNAETITRLVRSAPDHVRVFVEIPVNDDPEALLSAIRDAGASAKIRTGGVTEDAFPSAGEVTRFLLTAARIGVPFKATAGLHHPLRGEYRLTYEPGSVIAPMYGFLNIFMAAAAARQGADHRTVRRMLEEGGSSAFEFDADSVAWSDGHARAEDIEAMRREFGISFGSCSFTEPMDDLRSMELL
jgi:hypothetical protein